MAKSLIKPKPAKLTIAQQDLMLLILKKIKEQKQIEFKEIFSIYKNKVNHLPVSYVLHKEDGTTLHWSTPQTKNWVEYKAQEWFFRNIGLLVKKGYLTIIPKINL